MFCHFAKLSLALIIKFSEKKEETKPNKHKFCKEKSLTEVVVAKQQWLLSNRGALTWDMGDIGVVVFLVCAW